MNNRKPDWNDAPEWASWLAMDSDGAWWWYEREPRRGERTFGAGYGRATPAIVVISDWSETLESRP